MNDSTDRAVIQRLTSVDALRGCAAIAVAWFHIYTQNGSELVAKSAPHVLNVASTWGRFGVQLFFAISGLVLCYSLFPNRKIRSLRGVFHYFVRRSVRLDPTYWVVLYIYVVVVPFLNTALPEPFPPRDYSFSEIARNIIYFLPSSAPLYIPVAWTLAIEVQFYVLFSVFILIVNRSELEWGINRGTSLLCLIGAAGSLSLLQQLGILTMPGFWLYHNMHTFVVGMLIGLAIHRVNYSSSLLVLFSLALFLIGFRNNDSYILVSAISGAALWSSIFIRRAQSILSHWIFQFLGALSYCIYLLHQLVGGFIIYALQSIVSYERGLLQIGFILVGLIGTVLTASAIYVLVEKPTIRLSKSL